MPENIKKKNAKNFIKEINKIFFTEKLNENHQLLELNFFANKTEEIKEILEKDDNNSIKNFFKENDITNLIWKEEIIDYLIKKTKIAKETIDNLDFKFRHSNLNEWSIFIDCFDSDNEQKIVTSKKIYFKFELIKKEYIINHINYARLCFLLLLNNKISTTENNLILITKTISNQINIQKQKLTKINNINNEQELIASISKFTRESKNKIKKILFQKKLSLN